MHRQLRHVHNNIFNDPYSKCTTWVGEDFIQGKTLTLTNWSNLIHIPHSYQLLMLIMTDRFGTYNWLEPSSEDLSRFYLNWPKRE